MARIKITKTLVDGLEAPESGQAFVWDSMLPGFGVRITSKGGKSWIVQMRVRGGKERRMTVGRCAKVPLDKARTAAKELLASADLGHDPMQQRKDARNVNLDLNPLFLDFADRWLEEVVKPRNREGTYKHRHLLVQNHIAPRIGQLRLQEITRKHIEDLHSQVSVDYPVAANRVVSLCSAVFAVAVRWGLLEKNPAVQIERNPEHGRERYLTSDEISRILYDLARTEAQDSADVVRLLLLTGARVGEVLSMTWDQVDLDQGIWTKPASSTKQNRLHRVPLSGPALEVLAKRKNNREKQKRKSQWVFPGSGKNGHMTTIRTFWSAVCRRSNVQGARIHDLRHTFASLLVSSGESLPVIGALLGHTQAKTTARYAHLLDDPLKQAMDKVAALTSKAMS